MNNYQMTEKSTKGIYTPDSTHKYSLMFKCKWLIIIIPDAPLIFNWWHMFLFILQCLFDTIKMDVLENFLLWSCPNNFLLKDRGNLIKFKINLVELNNKTYLKMSFDIKY